MAEVKETLDAYLEVENGIIMAAHSDDIEPSFLPEGTTIVFAKVEDPEGLIGLSTRYIYLDIKDRPKLNEPSEQEVLRVKLRSLILDKQVAELLKEDTASLEAQINDTATQYNDLTTPK
jgi:hypothetical protein